MLTRKLPVTDRAKKKLDVMRATAGGNEDSFCTFVHEGWVFIVRFIRGKIGTMCAVVYGGVSKVVTEYEFTRLLDLSGALRQKATA